MDKNDRVLRTLHDFRNLVAHQIKREPILVRDKIVRDAMRRLRNAGVFPVEEAYLITLLNRIIDKESDRHLFDTTVGHPSGEEIDYELRFPRMLKLFSYLVGRRTRERVFLPAYHDLMADYLETWQQRSASPGARRWLNFCFWFRTIVLMLDCLAVGIRARIATILLPLLPTAVKDAIRAWWFTRLQ